MSDPTHWQVEVSKLLLQLTQETHALMHGSTVVWKANLGLLQAYVDWAEKSQSDKLEASIAMVDIDAT